MSSPFWTDKEVRTALRLEGNAVERQYNAISTDTRSVGKGDLFLALKGDKFDAHDFLEQAAESGATAAVVSRQGIAAPDGMALYQVDDTLAALQRLAAHRRSKLGAHFIGVVGSNGKTTTKELIRAVLSARFTTYATQANLNNQIGVPQTILGLPDDVEAAVIEMGTDRPGEIAALTEVVRPDHVVITSIGEEHLELLRDLDGVLEEEISVLRGLEDGGLVFVAEEPDALPRRAREAVGRNRVRVAGITSAADLRPDGGANGIRVLEDGSTTWQWRGIEIRLPIPGRFNVRNALLALGVGSELGVPATDATRSLSQVKLPKLRGEWVTYGDVKVLADCYNSNPPSLAAAVDLLASLPSRGRRIAVLGTMRELGPSSDQLHSAAADRIATMVGDQIDLVIATGDFFKAFEKHQAKLGSQLIRRDDPVEAYEQVRLDLQPTDTILLKASRGDQMERWLPLLERDFGAGDPAAENSSVNGS